MSEAFTAEAQRYVDALQLVTAALGSLTEFDQAAFATATAPLTSMHLAGATALIFVAPPTSHQDVGVVQDYWRGKGADGLVLHPYGAGEHVFSVTSRNLDGTSRSRNGLDLSRSDAAYSAIAESRRASRVTISAAYYLLIDANLPAKDRQLSFILVAPVWAAALSGPPQLRGWVLMGIRGQDFVAQVLRRSTQGLIDVTLRASDASGSLVRVAGLTADGAGSRDVQREVVVGMAQTNWVLHIAAVSRSLPGTSPSMSYTVNAAGIAGSLLLGTFLLTLVTGRARAYIQVDTATAELKTVASEARRQAGLLAAILESTSEAVDVVDEKGRFIVHNLAAKNLLGVADESSEAEANREGRQDWQSSYGIFTPDGAHPFPTEQLPLVRALAGESTDDIDMLIRNRRQPQGVLICVSGRPLDATAGQAGAVAVFRDVTKQRAHERELASFAGVVAHDLRGPLTVIHGYADLLRTALQRLDSADGDFAGGLLDHIAAGANSMTSLIDDLLGYITARDTALSLEDVDLSELVEDVIATTVPRGGPNAPATFVGDLPVAHADRARLRQVFTNLVGNALKYTPPGQAPRIDVTGRVDAVGNIILHIGDRGIGIPRGHHTAIFESFHRAHAGNDQYSGTGLGLAICREVIERHGGTIVATDNPGGGTRITLTLPPRSIHDASGIPAQDNRRRQTPVPTV